MLTGLKKQMKMLPAKKKERSVRAVVRGEEKSQIEFNLRSVSGNKSFAVVFQKR